MSLHELETRWLSLRYWLIRCVLPSSLVLIAVLSCLRLISDRPSVLDHNAVIVGFFTLYFVLVRGGHLMMIRSLHKELKQTFGKTYEAKLASLTQTAIRQHNLGFLLARIKRDLNAPRSGF